MAASGTPGCSEQVKSGTKPDVACLRSSAAHILHDVARVRRYIHERLSYRRRGEGASAARGPVAERQRTRAKRVRRSAIRRARVHVIPVRGTPPKRPTT
jgi:hypothetical protein